MRALPNILTGGRLALSLLVFFALAAAGGVWPAASWRGALELAAFVAFAVVSVWGAILDPIADKELICAAILGLLVAAPSLGLAIPAALILFREFAISALREVTAGRRISLPVTLLAKWKTTIQLVALGAEMIATAP